MLTEKQLSARKIGGSDVATILGINPFKTALELYHEKRGALEPADLSENTAVEAGSVLEDGIAELAAAHMARRWGRPVKLRRSNLTIVNPAYNWLTVHIDRDVVGEERGVECKNVGWRAAAGWGEPMTDEIPSHYLPQVHTYMLVKDYPVWTVAGYFGGADLRLYEVERSKVWDDIILDGTRDFWEAVQRSEPPPINLDAPTAERLVKKLYPGTDGSTVIATAEQERWLHVLNEAKILKAAYEQTCDGAKVHLLHAMKSAAVMQFADGSKLTRKQVTRAEYMVKGASYMDARISAPKRGSNDGQ